MTAFLVEIAYSLIVLVFEGIKYVATILNKER